MKNYALIGKRLGHSYSQRYFEELFAHLGLSDHTYRLAEMEDLSLLRKWVVDEGIAGFNVTIPYKKAVLPLLDAVDISATAIGAVNCVTVKEGLLTGHNTDAPAFGQTIDEDPAWALGEDTLALVLGTGGAARAVGYALKERGQDCYYVSRKPITGTSIGYDDAYRQVSAWNPKHPNGRILIVNATPVGMYPDTEGNPWSRMDLIDRRCLVYDLIYNPSPTLLLKQAAEGGATTKNGLAMLYRQAELSWELFRS